MAYFIMSETIKGLFLGLRNKEIDLVQQVVGLWGMTLLQTLPLHLTWVISWILLKIQILLRLFIQKRRGIKKSTIDCACLSFRWLGAYS